MPTEGLGAEESQRLKELRDVLADAEAGAVQGFPTTEEAIRRLRKEVEALEARLRVGDRTALDGGPGSLTVGQPFGGGYVPDGSIGFYPDAIPFLLLMGMGSPSRADLDAFHDSGNVEFALVPMGKLLITMVKFPSVRRTPNGLWGYWMEGPWAHREESWFDLEPLETGMASDDPRTIRYGVSVCLVDSHTSLVAGLRFFTLSPHYSRVYHQELARALAESPISNEEFVRLVNEYQARYADPKQLLNRATARCKAGLKD